MKYGSQGIGWSRLKRGAAQLGCCHAKELRLDLGSDMVSLKGLKRKINSLQLSSARFLLKILMCFIWDFLIPSKSHWGYHPPRLHAAFHRINRRTQNNNLALDSPSHSFRGTENLSHGAEPKMHSTRLSLLGGPLLSSHVSKATLWSGGRLQTLR